MHHAVLWSIIFAFSAAAMAQDFKGTSNQNPSSRESLLKQMVAQDHGEITAIEPLSKEGGGVIIGYSSGAVLNCYGDQSCQEFAGTPSAAVEHIAVSNRGASEIIWVTYRQGALYQCVNFRCEKFKW